MKIAMKIAMEIAMEASAQYQSRAGDPRRGLQ
jgi:hypothetical protein